MTTTESSTEQTVSIAGLSLRVVQGGSGASAVWLHHSTGSLGWLPFHEALAQNFAVSVPDLPGFGQSERPAWARHPRDMAIMVLRAIDELDLGPTLLMGSGFGGWIAAEAATMSPGQLSGLVLIGAAGVQPDEGEIVDVIMHEHDEYVRLGFSKDAAYEEFFGEAPEEDVKQLWDFSREMTARLTWKPWMFNRQLPHLLSTVQTPTLIVWGADDRIVPRSSADLYHGALPNSRLEIVDGAGHIVELEQPDALASLIANFAGNS